jgi:hypothetical protein
MGWEYSYQVRNVAMPLKLLARKPSGLATGLRIRNVAGAAEDSSVKGNDFCALDKLIAKRKEV